MASASEEPTLLPTQLPSYLPTRPPQSALINIVMRLENTYGRLVGDASNDFQNVTASHIAQEIVKSVQPDGLIKLVQVRCVIYGQTVVAPEPSDGNGSRRDLTGLPSLWLRDNPDYYDNASPDKNTAQAIPSESQMRRHRNLQQTGDGSNSQQPLRVGLNVYVDFQSERDDNDVADWVGDCFNSNSKRQRYIDRLKAANPTSFGILESTTVLIEGEKPEEEAPAAPPLEDNPSSTSSSNTIWFYIASGAGVILVAFVIGMLICRKSKKRRRHELDKQHLQQQQQQYAKQEARVSGGGGASGISFNNMGEDEGRWAAEINVDRQDDISTLGDPVGLPAMNMTTGAHGEDRTASVAVNYDYEFLGGGTMQRNRLPSAEDSDAFEVSNNSSSILNVPQLAATHAVFAEDASFDEVFNYEDGVGHRARTDTSDRHLVGNAASMDRTGSDMTVKHVKFRVDVPCGKLGMVIDTPDGGAPVVHAIKPDSVLADRVMMGDYLVEFDGEDVRHMSAVAVSQMISQKSEQERVMYFVRRVVLERTDDTVLLESRAC